MAASHKLRAPRPVTSTPNCYAIPVKAVAKRAGWATLCHALLHYVDERLQAVLFDLMAGVGGLLHRVPASPAATGCPQANSGYGLSRALQGSLLDCQERPSARPNRPATPRHATHCPDSSTLPGGRAESCNCGPIQYSPNRCSTPCAPGAKFGESHTGAVEGRGLRRDDRADDSPAAG